MKIQDLVKLEKVQEKHPYELEDIREILRKFFGREIDNFYIHFNSNQRARVHLKTSKTYIKKNNGKHPYEAVGKQIIKHYYKYGKETVCQGIADGFYKKG